MERGEYNLFVYQLVETVQSHSSIGCSPYGRL